MLCFCQSSLLIAGSFVVVTRGGGGDDADRSGRGSRGGEACRTKRRRKTGQTGLHHSQSHSALHQKLLVLMREHIDKPSENVFDAHVGGKAKPLVDKLFGSAAEKQLGCPCWPEGHVFSAPSSDLLCSACKDIIRCWCSNVLKKKERNAVAAAQRRRCSEYTGRRQRMTSVLTHSKGPLGAQKPP